MRAMGIICIMILINSCAFPPTEVELGAHAIKQCIEKCEWYNDFPYIKFKKDTSR